VQRHDHIVELPDRAVLLHTRDGVIDVELPGHALRLAHQLALLIELDIVNDLVLLRDFDAARVDVHLADFHSEDDLAIEPDALDDLAVRVAVVEPLDAAGVEALAAAKRRLPRANYPSGSSAASPISRPGTSQSTTVGSSAASSSTR